MPSSDPTDPNDKPSFIPDEYLMAVGRIANAWAHLEFAVDRATWQLADVPHMVGACMTAQMFSMPTKMKALISLAELRGLSADTLSALRKFNSAKLAPLQEARNRHVHDTRLVHQSSGEVARLQITAKNELVFGFQHEPIAEMHKVRKRIEGLIEEFHVMRDKLFAEFAALPKDSGRRLLNLGN